METKLYNLHKLECHSRAGGNPFKHQGNSYENGLAKEGEIYTTSLELPFEGKTKSPLWFSCDPDHTVYQQQLLQAEIVRIEDLNEYSANAEIFVHQSARCENLRNIFPVIEMPESW